VRVTHDSTYDTTQAQASILSSLTLLCSSGTDPTTPYSVSWRAPLVFLTTCTCVNECAVTVLLKPDLIVRHDVTREARARHSAGGGEGGGALSLWSGLICD